MLVSIIKRDGTEVPFDSVKILNAITKANQAVGGEDMSPTDLLFVTEKVCKKLESRSLKHVEEIQDVVEETLIQYDYAKSAKAYILYRAEHTKIRNAESYLMDIYKKLTYSPALQEDIKRENANIDGDTAMGTMLKYGSEGSKFFIDNYILPKDASAAHINGDIHIHDKDFYMLTETCCQIDLIPLFKNGFSTGHGHLREPNSIESYSALACIAIQANQNEMHGGQSVPHFDFAMAEGVVKTYRKEYERAFAAFLRIINGLEEQAAIDAARGFIGLLPEGPRLGTCDDFGAALTAAAPEDQRDIVARAHAYAAGEALKYTERRTYQAMECVAVKGLLESMVCEKRPHKSTSCTGPRTTMPKVEARCCSIFWGLVTRLFKAASPATNSSAARFSGAYSLVLACNMRQMPCRSANCLPRRAISILSAMCMQLAGRAFWSSGA